MNREQATQVVAYLNAGFPRDALEPESAVLWVTEVEALDSFDAALAAARAIVRSGDRFPTVNEFRTGYRQQRERTLPPALPEAPPGEIPDDVLVWLAERGLTAAEIKDGEIVLGGGHGRAPRPVWDRHERREQLLDLLPPSPLEIHDAIVVLRDHNPSDETYVGRALHTEAQRILDDASAA